MKETKFFSFQPTFTFAARNKLTYGA